PDALPLSAVRAGAGTDRRPRSVPGRVPAIASSSIDSPRIVPILGRMMSFGPMVRFRPRPRMRHVLAVVVLVAFAATPVRAVEPAAQSSPGGGDGTPAPVHTHTWVKQSQKEWVPPEKQTVQVGVDAKGKPVYETKIVKPGYWRTVTIWRCSCGQTRR